MANKNGFKRLNAKEYAAIATAKENAALITSLIDEVKKGGVTKAYKALMKIDEINAKWAADFGNLDLSFRPAAAPAQIAAEQPAVETEVEG